MPVASWGASSGVQGDLHVAIRVRDLDAAAEQRRMAISDEFFDDEEIMEAKDADVARYAQMLSAMGTEPRLRIMRLLLSAHPEGMIVGDIQAELGIPGSTLSHHLEKLKYVGLARVQREHTCLCYSANTEILQELLGFLYEECCSRNRAVNAEKIFQKCC